MKGAEYTIRKHIDFSENEEFNLGSHELNEHGNFTSISIKPVTDEELSFHLEQEANEESTTFNMINELKILFRHTIWFLIKFALAYIIGMIVVYIVAGGINRQTTNDSLLYIYSLIPTATVFGLANKHKKRGNIDE